LASSVFFAVRVEGVQHRLALLQAHGRHFLALLLAADPLRPGGLDLLDKLL